MAALLAAWIGLLALPGPAWADGAFPDSLQLLLAADRPQQIILATNFGLVITSDDGRTWRWVCEEAVGLRAQLYQLGPPPADRVFAVTGLGLRVSTDTACSFDTAQGALAGSSVLDAFPDPADPARVLAVAATTPDQDQSISALYQSTDAGQTFTGPLFRAPPGALLSGVEIARSDPRVISLTSFESANPLERPRVSRSADGGATWQTYDEQAILGTSIPRLAAIDPLDPLTLYLRVIGQQQDELVISTDGGMTVQHRLALAGTMSAFLRRTDGTLLVGTLAGPAFRSADGGRTFVPWPTAPHLRALAERGGVLYAAANNLLDRFAVARSMDGGMTWQPLLSFSAIQGVQQCPGGALSAVASVCAGAPWNNLMASLGISPPRVPAAAASSGGGCSVGGLPGGGGLGAGGLALGLLWLAWALRRWAAPMDDGCPA